MKKNRQVIVKLTEKRSCILPTVSLSVAKCTSLPQRFDLAIKILNVRIGGFVASTETYRLWYLLWPTWLHWSKHQKTCYNRLQCKPFRLKHHHLLRFEVGLHLQRIQPPKRTQWCHWPSLDHNCRKKKTKRYCFQYIYMYNRSSVYNLIPYSLLAQPKRSKPVALKIRFGFLKIRFGFWSKLVGIGDRTWFQHRQNVYTNLKITFF